MDGQHKASLVSLRFSILGKHLKRSIIVKLLSVYRKKPFQGITKDSTVVELPDFDLH